MDNAGEDPNAGAGIPGQGGPLDDNLGGGIPGDAGDDGENVDQFYDDGGETFLPADHVSALFPKLLWFQIRGCGGSTSSKSSGFEDSIWLRMGNAVVMFVTDFRDSDKKSNW